MTTGAGSGPAGVVRAAASPGQPAKSAEPGQPPRPGGPGLPGLPGQSGQSGLPGQSSPVTKAARHAQITAILAQPGSPVRSQDELVERLGRRGVRVTQATLSRDLEELGAVRLRGVYALPGEAGPGGIGVQPGASGLGGDPSGRLARIAQELLIAAEASANLVVLRTPAGAAQLLASVIDHSGWPEVLGTVGGDDTVLVIARDPVGGGKLARALLQLAERRAPDGGEP
jgi:transcriptional regulator of arginine metabolism